jgi:hypothetical protein
MKKLSMLALAGALTFAIVGCGSDPVSVEVNKFLEFKKGDVFTYDVYDLDQNQARVDSTRTVRIWTVDTTGLTFESKVNVTRVFEVNYKADGVTELNRDTIYLQTDQQGLVWQYDVFGSILKRIPGAEAAAEQLTPQWVWIGDVKTSGARTWPSLPTVAGQNVTILSIPISLQYSMDASHVGKESVTVAAGTYNAFVTDHTVNVKGTEPGTGTVMLDDSMMLHYSIDINGGIVRETLDSKSVHISSPLSFDQPVPGFDMELVAVTRAK